jgi:hypothetical protein
LYRDAPGGVRLTTISVTRVPVGTRVEARCGRCGKSQVRTARKETVSLTAFAGRFVRAGDKIEIFVTRSKTTSGRYRHGAIGNYYRFFARSGGVSPRLDRCLKPDSKTPLKRCA